MANLVPLFIDKDTGDIVSSGHGNSGSSSNSDGYEYLQAIPLDTWVVTHNKNNDKLLVQVYDDNEIFILPNEIKIVDNNTVKISFNTPMTGIVKIAFF